MQDLNFTPVPESRRVDEPQGTTKATSSRKRELVVVGDSIIRGMDIIVCARKKDCLPGTQAEDILEHVNKLLAGRAGWDPVVMVHVTNDIGKARLGNGKNRLFRPAMLAFSKHLFHSTLLEIFSLFT